MAHNASTKVIINLSSGPTEQETLRKQVSEAFDRHGLQADISFIKSGENVTESAEAAARGHWKIIAAGGGDGTIGAIASKIIKTDKVLGVLPLGTLNHFARDLGISRDIGEAARTIAAGHVVHVDVGEVNGSIFLNNSSLGLYPIIVREREKKERLGSSKWPAFVWAALTALRRYPFLDVRLSVEGKQFHRRTPFVFVGNNEYAMESFNIGLRERVDRGELIVYIANRTGRWGLLRLALRAFFGRLKNDKDFLALKTTELKIETRRSRLRVALDGEVAVMKGPLLYRVRPRALRVIVPAEIEK